MGEGDVVKVTPGTMAIAAHSPDDIRQIIRGNLGGSFNIGDFDRIKVPLGGGTKWSVPDIDGEVLTTHITGVVIHWTTNRAFWAKGLDEGGGDSPPDCNSKDGETGNGEPGGECATCEKNEFGSAKKGKGKACKEMKILFILREEDRLPLILVLPPTSILPFRKFMRRLASKAIPYWGIKTKITLEATKSEGGIAFSQAVFAKESDLSDKERGAVKAYVDVINPSLATVRTETEDIKDAATDE